MSASAAKDLLKLPHVNLKFIPSAQQGKVDVAKLTMFNYEDVIVKEAYTGYTQLDLISHVNCPVADLPIRKMLEGYQILADVSFGRAKVMHDYLLDKSYFQA